MASTYLLHPLISGPPIQPPTPNLLTSHPNLPAHRLRNLHKRPRPHTLRLRNNSRSAAVRVVADASVQGDVAEEIDAVGGAFALHAFGAEDWCGLLAVRAGEDGHVLDHAEDLGVGREC